MDTNSSPSVKTPVEQIASVPNMYYNGMSLNAIRRQPLQMHNNYSLGSIYCEWIDIFAE